MAEPRPTRLPEDPEQEGAVPGGHDIHDREKEGAPRRSPAPTEAARHSSFSQVDSVQASGQTDRVRGRAMNRPVLWAVSVLVVTLLIIWAVAG